MTIPYKQVKKVLVAGLLINLLIYSLTLFRVSGSYDLYFRNPIERPLYIYVNVGVNKYVGGAPFASRTIYYYDVEGCPCGGIEKAIVIWPMVLSPAFFANWALWSIPPAAYFLFRRRYAHTRH